MIILLPFATSSMIDVGPPKILLPICVHPDGKYAISEEMCNCQFYLRNLNGEWLAKVQPFDPEFFCIKFHPNAVPLYVPFRSQLTLLQHLCLQLQLLPPSPRYWPRADGTLALIETGRWRSKRRLNTRADSGRTDGTPVWSVGATKGPTDCCPTRPRVLATFQPIHYLHCCCR